MTLKWPSSNQKLPVEIDVSQVVTHYINAHHAQHGKYRYVSVPFRFLPSFLATNIKLCTQSPVQSTIYAPYHIQQLHVALQLKLLITNFCGVQQPKGERKAHRPCMYLLLNSTYYKNWGGFVGFIFQNFH